MEKLFNDIEPNKDSAGTEELWISFKGNLQAAVKKHIPHKQVWLKENKPCFVTPSLDRLMKMRDRLYKKMRKKGCEVHEEVYKHLRREVQQNLSVLFVVPE